MSENRHSTWRADASWNPCQYEKFSTHRLRAAIELLSRIPLASPEVIVDLGCGTGNVTRLIAKRWPSARMYAFDNSEEMLKKAQSDSSRIHWDQADIADWVPPEPPDLIYSNATLHWLGNHRKLFPRLAANLRAGGCLAVQMPLSWDLPSHRLMRATLDDGGAGGQSLGTEALRKSVARKWVEQAEFYFDLLEGAARSIDIWETEYLQVLEGADAVFEWVQGTGLRPILNGLAEEERQVFLIEYRRRLSEAYPMKPNGKTLYRFRRLFIVAVV
ncbi:MAG: methyltransferase domain-containing protein [Gammaproteobacteria bacterium]|nr:methyltransferase domain-containing protein [Gammaproteobacteria bacterium]